MSKFIDNMTGKSGIHFFLCFTMEPNNEFNHIIWKQKYLLIKQCLSLISSLTIPYLVLFTLYPNLPFVFFTLILSLWSFLQLLLLYPYILHFRYLYLLSFIFTLPKFSFFVDSQWSLHIFIKMTTLKKLLKSSQK